MKKIKDVMAKPISVPIMTPEKNARSMFVTASPAFQTAYNHTHFQ